MKALLFFMYLHFNFHRFSFKSFHIHKRKAKWSHEMVTNCAKFLLFLLKCWHCYFFFEINFYGIFFLFQSNRKFLTKKNCGNVNLQKKRIHSRKRQRRFISESRQNFYDWTNLSMFCERAKHKFLNILQYNGI